MEMNKIPLNANDANKRISRMPIRKIRDIRTFAIFALSLLTILALLLSPIATVRAQGGASVTASAVIVPAQVSELGFLSTALVREVSVAQGETVEAGQMLATLDTPELEYAVAAAEAAYRSAQSYAELQHSRTVKTKDFRGRTLIISLPREVYMRDTALAEAAHTSLEVTQAALALSTLTAPYDGTIAAVHVLPGELVQTGQPIITLATLDKLQIETTDLSERDIAKIKIGQKATVFIEALDAEFPATVTAIAPRAETLGGDVVFKITLAFDEQPAGLLWGMTAEVTISAE
jgi:RND family efflux transporter MFP subunit